MWISLITFWMRGNILTQILITVFKIISSVKSCYECFQYLLLHVFSLNYISEGILPKLLQFLLGFCKIILYSPFIFKMYVEGFVLNFIKH